MNPLRVFAAPLLVLIAALGACGYEINVEHRAVVAAQAQTAALTVKYNDLDAKYTSLVASENARSQRNTERVKQAEAAIAALEGCDVK